MEMPGRGGKGGGGSRASCLEETSREIDLAREAFSICVSTVCMYARMYLCIYVSMYLCIHVSIYLSIYEISIPQYWSGLSLITHVCIFTVLVSVFHKAAYEPVWDNDRQYYY